MMKKLRCLVVLAGVMFFINAPISTRAEGFAATTIADTHVMSDSKIEDLKETISDMNNRQLSDKIVDYKLQSEKISDTDTIIYNLILSEKKQTRREK